VKDEFGENGQMRTTATSLRSLFDPAQDRIDKHHWQKMLVALLDTAPDCWDRFRQRLGNGEWSLEVDGIVYVHQYEERESGMLSTRNEELLAETAKHLSFPADGPVFCLGPNARRLRLKARNEIVHLFAQAAVGG
jgi:hypothetical protein